MAGQSRHVGVEVRTTGSESQVQQDRVVLELGCALGALDQWDDVLNVRLQEPP